MIDFSQLKFYGVMNSEGKLFRAKGYNDSDETWVDDITKARFYGKPGPARTQISFFANRYLNYPAPQLIEVSVGEVKVLDETKRIEKARRQHKKREIAQAKYQLEYYEKQKTIFVSTTIIDRNIENWKNIIAKLEGELS